MASLRTERRKGHLETMKIAGKIAVTETAIRNILERCREEPVVIRDVAPDLWRRDHSSGVSLEARKRALAAAL